MALLLGGATSLLFSPAISHDFVNLDDDLYVYNNPVVQQGLTVSGLSWAWGGVHHGYWLPMLWVSYMLDTQLFGTGPSGYHFTNVLLHALNTTLLFLLLTRTTGRRWLSFVTAALFGWHPLRVESVAWITERKDVLSTMFGLLAVWAYSRSVEPCEPRAELSEGSARNSGSRTHTTRNPPSQSPATRTSRFYHGLGLVLFALGLMSKPMLVSLPALLLVLDVWPLKRVGATWTELRQKGWGLIWEKWPWWVAAVVFSGITYYTQLRTGAVISVEKVPLGERLWEVPLAYGFYLAKTFWPKGLAVVYPGLDFSWSAFVLGLVVLGGLTFGVVRGRGRCAPLSVGWFWFVVTLLPVIGLVRVGAAQVADRFTYLPSIGLGILLAWGLAWLVTGWRYQQAALAGCAAAALAGCAATTWLQLKHWKDSETLLKHALAVTANNALAHNNLGAALFQVGRVSEAIEHHEQTLRIDPEDAAAHSNLGAALFKQGKVAEALAHLEQALRLKPDFADGHYNLGTTLIQLGKVPEGIGHLEQALRLEPDSAEGHYSLGTALIRLGKVPEGIGHLEQALRLKPDFADGHYNLGTALIRLGKVPEGIGHLEQTLRLEPDFAEGHYNLGTALIGLGKVSEGIGHLEQALRLKPEDAAGQKHLAWLQATCADGSVRNGARAIEHAEQAHRLSSGKDAGILDTLAAAYAEAGRFGEAVQTALKAVELAQGTAQTEQAQAIQERLQLYQTGRPYHEGPTQGR